VRSPPTVLTPAPRTIEAADEIHPSHPLPESGHARALRLAPQPPYSWLAPHWLHIGKGRRAGLEQPDPPRSTMSKRCCFTESTAESSAARPARTSCLPAAGFPQLFLL
jgi:hypothetical protein